MDAWNLTKRPISVDARPIHIMKQSRINPTFLNFKLNFNLYFKFNAETRRQEVLKY